MKLTLITLIYDEIFLTSYFRQENISHAHIKRYKYPFIKK